MKFRARLKETGEILEQSYDGQCFQWVNQEKQEGIIIEQSTGHLDVNGCEIYQGDTCINKTGRLAKCEWVNSISSFDFISLNSDGDSYGFNPQLWSSNLKVVSSI